MSVNNMPPIDRAEQSTAHEIYIIIIVYPAVVRLQAAGIIEPS
ncbi:hypothetical protein ACQLJG_001506 [Escherichia coli]